MVRQIVHEHPAWEPWGDICIPVYLAGAGVTEDEVEHLWCRQVEAHCFMLCCIPFACFNVALGDTIDVSLHENGYYQIEDVANRSTHSTFHIVFGSSNDHATQFAVASGLRDLGCQSMEWQAQDELVISVLPDIEGKTFDLLDQWEWKGKVQFAVPHSHRDCAEHTVRHAQPARLERAYTFVYAPIQKGEWARYERLSAHRVDETHFEICCIPFFIYGLALDDVVAVGMQDEKPRVIQRVVRESRRVTYRVYFGKTSDPTSIQDVSPRLQAFGCLIEWYSPDYLALDVPLNAAHPVVVYLVDQERRGRLIWEDGTRRGVPGGKT